MLHRDRIGLDGCIAAVGHALTFYDRHVLWRRSINPTWSRDNAAQVLDPAYALDYIIRGVNTSSNALRGLLSWRRTLRTIIIVGAPNLNRRE